MPYNVKLKIFEGPLDLLLHLIKKNELDIYDIPIATIAEQYLEYLDLMRTLNLDIAGEFIVMAATLMHIKSKMLLPKSEEMEETEYEEDPRAELVRRLIEYKRYKDAAKKLMDSEVLDRDVYTGGRSCEVTDDKQEDLHELNIFELIEAFERVLKENAPQGLFHIAAERMSVNDKIIEIIDRMTGVTSISFRSLFSETSERQELILTFLALLELIKLRIVRVIQIEPFEPIRIIPIHLELPESFGA
ncbi:MAG: segregation/condensation protein A [Thermodesulfobacteriota bacterium]|nr:segregation/condensation protein A [Thermodesulfobacteriota bacterium]